MNNSISQESIDSLNDFITNYERERDARKARKEREEREESKAAYERAMRKREELESSFSYKVVTIAKDMLDIAGSFLVGLAKFALVAVVLLSPYILEAIIDKWL